MPQKPKPPPKPDVDPPKTDAERGYYYDDAYGYEPYQPDNDEVPDSDPIALTEKELDDNDRL